MNLISKKNKIMAKLKNRIIHLFTSTAGHLLISAILIMVGGIFGTNGVLEIQTQKQIWDYVMWSGIGIMVIYAIFGIYYAIRNLISDIKGE